MAGKKSVVAKKDKPAGRAGLTKRPRQKVGPAIKPSPPAKRVNHTTTPSASPSPAAGHSGVKKQPASAIETIPARPASVAGESVVPPSVEKAPVSHQAVPTTKENSPKNPKPTVFVLEESEGSDEVPLARRHPTRQRTLPVSEMAVQPGPSSANRGKHTVEEPTPAAEPLVPSQDQGVPASTEAAAPIGPSAADRGKRLLEEPEATAESPIHPQDQGFHIPPQEVTSAFASWEVEFKALLSSTTAESGPSVAPTEAADPSALTQLREVLSLSSSQAGRIA
nr:predicted GPI-anchored protein 58 [Malus domestica]